MKVLLLPPLVAREKIWGKYSKEGGFIPPIGLLSIAAYLESKGHLVRIVDPLPQKISEDKLSEFLKKESFELIGISSFTNTIKDTYTTAKFCKKILPKVKIVIGGIHATVLPRQTMEECRDIDFLVMGEGEVTTGELVDQLQQAKPVFEKVEGLCFRSSEGKIKINKRREVIDDLGSLPFPAYHLLDMAKYVPHPTQYKTLPSFPTVAQRGCPYNCAFCGAHIIHGRKIRFKPVNYLISEIKMLIDLYQAKGIHFQDSTFTVNRDYVLTFCRAIIRQGLKFKWDINTRVDCVDSEMLILMKKAGLWMINFGLESGNQASLDLLNKGITIDQMKKTIALVRKQKIVTFSTWILGLPNEDESKVRRRIGLAKEIGTELALFFLPVPYPGTRLMDICQKDKGLRKNAKWEDYSAVDFSNPIYVNPLLGEKKMKNLLKYAFLSYYFSPKILWRNLRTIENLEDIKRYFRGLKALFYGWLV